MLPRSTTGPLLIYGTRHGTLYNLTPSNLPKSIPAVQLNYGDFHDHLDALQSLPPGMTIKQFLGYPASTLTYLAPYDFSKLDCMSGCHYNNKVKIKCNKGYTEITAPLYDRMIEVLKPDYYVGLTQYPSLMKKTVEAIRKSGNKQADKGENKEHVKQKQQEEPDQKQVLNEQKMIGEQDEQQLTSNKSNKRAICKTKSYLELSPHTKSQGADDYQGPVRLASIHGGRNLSLISRSLQQVLDHAIDGLVVCDLCEGETLQEREQVYNTINSRLEQEYVREGSWFRGRRLMLVLAGLGKLEDIEHAMKFGFEAFEVNYPFQISQKQQALIRNKQTGLFEPHSPIKKQQLKPLCPDCQCHTCLNHSESYIAHLIQCYELTAKVLLSIHNTHVYENWLRQRQNKA